MRALWAGRRYVTAISLCITGYDLIYGDDVAGAGFV